MQNPIPELSSAANIHVPKNTPFDGGRGFSHRSRLGLFLVWLFSAPLGGHRFYLGDSRGGFAQIALSIFTFGLGAVVSFFDGLYLLFTRNEDENGKTIAGWGPAPSASLDKRHQSKYFKHFKAGNPVVQIQKEMNQEVGLLLFCTFFGIFTVAGALVAPIAWYLMERQQRIRKEIGLSASFWVACTKLLAIFGTAWGFLLLILVTIYTTILFGASFLLIASTLTGL